MEQHEIQLIEKHSEVDAELKALWDLHVGYKKQLEALMAKPGLTEVEEMEIKELKKKKLAGKTKLQQILDRYKTEA
jgi:hypothetical protein